MVDFDKITRAIAEDLCRSETPSKGDVEKLVRDAFRRGLEHGRSLRTPSTLARPAIEWPPAPPPALMH